MPPSIPKITAKFINYVFKPDILWKHFHPTASYEDPTMPYNYTEPGQFIPYDNPNSIIQTVACGLHHNCYATYVVTNGHVTAEYHSCTVTQGGTATSIQGQGLVGVGGPNAGAAWVGTPGPAESVLAKDEAPPPERPDDLDLLSWESIARNRFRRRRWQCESGEYGQWLSSFSNPATYVQPGQATQG